MRQKKTWLKAEIWATKAMLEVAQAAFAQCEAIGIEIDDGELPLGRRKFSADTMLITAYFSNDAEIKDQIEETLARFFAACDLSPMPINFSLIEEEDWQGNFIRSCTTFKIEPNIYIVPSFEIDQWRQEPLSDLYIVMDPENAFGTGQHQTTQLCLKNIFGVLSSLSEDKQKRFRCADIGTGSGILAILMKKMSVSSVLATETDDDALTTAKKNAAKNSVDFDALLVTEDYRYQENSFDFVVANILASVLVSMATNLVESLRADGYLLLSGILNEQAAMVIKTYENSGLKLIRHDTLDDWSALLFTKAA